MRGIACSITVPYRGNATLPTLLAGLEGTRYLSLSDEAMNIALETDSRVQVEFPISTEPKADRQFGLIFRRTPEILESLAGLGMRALNIAECLVLAKQFPEDRFAALGQKLHMPYGAYSLYVMPLGVGLVQFDWAWSPSWSIPATRAPDPLALEMK